MPDAGVIVRLKGPSAGVYDLGLLFVDGPVEPFDQRLVGEDGTTEMGTKIILYEQTPDVVFEEVKSSEPAYQR